MARPRIPKLSLERITDEALALIDSGAQFGVNQLARSLNVRPSSLYTHVSGRADIIELVRQRIVAEGDLALNRSLPWHESIERAFRAQRDIYARHPHALALLVENTVTSPDVVAYYAELAEVLLEAGFPEGEVLPIIEILDALALGFGLDQAAPSDVWRTEDATSSFGRLLARAETGTVRSARAYDLGLSLLLGALRQRLGELDPA